MFGMLQLSLTQMPVESLAGPAWGLLWVSPVGAQVRLQLGCEDILVQPAAL